MLEQMLELMRQFATGTISSDEFSHIVFYLRELTEVCNDVLDATVLDLLADKTTGSRMMIGELVAEYEQRDDIFHPHVVEGESAHV